MGAPVWPVNQTRSRGVDGWVQALWDRLVAPGCVICGAACRRGEDLCDGCLADLPERGPACHRCAAPLPRATTLPCGSCLRNEPAFDQVWAPYPYAAPLDVLVQSFKYGRRLALGRSLARLMLKRPPSLARPDELVPVPLHHQRFMERGFNQASELCLHLGRALDLPRRQHLARPRPTRSQSRLAAGDRRANLAGAFACGADLKDRHIALVDDVMTTGSTAHRCARALKRAGARRVDVWVVARA